MATSGLEWADIIAQYNSGTYNNQYMVIDLKLFRPGRELQPGLLWVVEQLPGMTIAADQTQVEAHIAMRSQACHRSCVHKQS